MDDECITGMSDWIGVIGMTNRNEWLDYWVTLMFDWNGNGWWVADWNGRLEWDDREYLGWLKGIEWLAGMGNWNGIVIWTGRAWSEWSGMKELDWQVWNGLNRYPGMTTGMTERLTGMFGIELTWDYWTGEMYGEVVAWNDCRINLMTGMLGIAKVEWLNTNEWAGMTWLEWFDWKAWQNDRS